MREKKSK